MRAIRNPLSRPSSGVTVLGQVGIVTTTASTRHCVPQRAAFRTEPVEGGGSSRQKLTDYVVHIASDSLLPLDVVARMLVRWPACHASSGTSREARQPFASGQHHALINAHGEPAKFWVGRVGGLTGRMNLASLTFLPFENVLHDPLGLVGRGRRWCPLCLQEDLMNGSPIYERLIWSVRMVTWCPVHWVPLSGRCPSCDYLHRSELCRRPLSGFCAHCRQWLGLDRSSYRYTQRRADRAVVREQWIAAQFASLLDLPEAPVRAMSRDGVLAMLESGIDMVGDGNARRFAEICGSSPSSLAEWRARLVFPSIQTILDLAARFRMPLTGWLQGHVALWTSIPERREYVGNQVSTRARALPRDWAVVERKLRVIVDRDSYQLSWEKTAKGLGVDPSALRRQFPELAARVVRKARAGRARSAAARRDARTATLARHVRKTVADLIRGGRPLGRRSIERELDKRGFAYRWADYPLMARVTREVMSGMGTVSGRG
jgi:transcriptional regulator with XRE-family HTH domain